MDWGWLARKLLFLPPPRDASKSEELEAAAEAATLAVQKVADRHTAVVQVVETQANTLQGLMDELLGRLNHDA